LAEAKVDKKDILRIRLSLEEILGVWLERLGGANAVCIKGKRGRRNFIEFSVEGPQLDPGDEENEAEFLLTSHLLANAGLALSYSYKNGRNCLSITPPRKISVGQPLQILIALTAAFLCGFICKAFLPNTRETIISAVMPLFDMMCGALRAVSTPLIFFAVSSSISDIGDISRFNRLGKRIIGRFLIFSIIVSVFTACCIFPFLSVKYGSGSHGTGLYAVYKMILDIVPSDIVTPFQSGNALQVIFLAIVMGMVLLVLGDRVSPVRDALSLLNIVTNFIMALISRLLPVFVFLCILNIFLSDFTAGFGTFIKILFLAVTCCYLVITFYFIAVSVRFRVKPAVLLKKLLPVHLITITTASSSAAFTTNLETCEKYLGISRNIVNFAVPLGQVIFKPGGIIEYLVVTAALAEIYGVAMTPLWIVNAVIIVTLTLIAAPPIPGAGLMLFTLIFSQLSIPAEAIAVAVVADGILDFFNTSCNLSSLQLELIFDANDSGMLDKDVLRKRV
ncbi:MAG: cation:dicarboxylase symporter family transporter, partial [Synergistes sp.]|nr:cation:dicarboxylase symporter family transporter [Synergistes sp.]